jgi:hypothetical protein
MKVLCVDTPAHSYTIQGVKATIPPIYVGNEYTVVDIVNWHFRGKDWVVYELLEIPAAPMHFYYASDLFAELSNEDETELVNTKEEVYA